jgi:hypothetical protein
VAPRDEDSFIADERRCDRLRGTASSLAARDSGSNTGLGVLEQDGADAVDERHAGIAGTLLVT